VLAIKSHYLSDTAEFTSFFFETYCTHHLVTTAIASKGS
jgi:hypothetical protein